MQRPVLCWLAVVLACSLFASPALGTRQLRQQGCTDGGSNGGDLMAQGVAGQQLPSPGQSAGQTTQVGAVDVVLYSGKNLDATLMVLDVNSLQYKGNHPYQYGLAGPETSTSEKCAQRCARTTGCNAFVSCDKPEGCGSGCKAYVAGHPALQATPDQVSYESYSLPIQSFGSFTYPSYWKDGCANTTADSQSETGDKWGWGLCSLKTVTDVNNLQFWDESASTQAGEFTSGVLVKPANCPDGLPISVCASCNNLGDGSKTQQCLDCASNFKYNNPVKEAQSIGDRTYDFCAKCFGEGRNPFDCIQCIKDKAPEGQEYTCVM